MIPSDAAAMNMFSMARQQSSKDVPHSLAETRIITGALRMGSPIFAAISGGIPGGSGSDLRAAPNFSSISGLLITVKCHGCRFMPVGAYSPAVTMVSSASSVTGFFVYFRMLRRRAMAAERRRIARRTTTSPCPSKEALLEAWRHVRDSKEALVRFGSMMQDLECYVDNSLRFDRSGRIVGRNAGVKGWLAENAPEIAAHYTSAIRYKAAAKKLRQIVGLADPTPVAEVLGPKGEDTARGNRSEGGGSCNYGAEKSHGEGVESRGDSTGRDAGTGETSGNGAEDSPPVEVVRARAVYLEAMEGVPDVAARVMARIDALCDPERTDEAATLRSWREKYDTAITVRRKDSWWRRLTA